MEQRILVVVDIQNDFCDKGGILYHPNCGEVADRIAQVVVKEIDAGTKVLFSLDSHWWGEYGGTKEAEEFPLHTEVGSWGEKLSFNNYVMSKIHLSFTTSQYRKPNFMNMNLAKSLEGFVKEIEDRDDYATIEICGVLTSICVLNLALLARVVAPKATIIVKKHLTADIDEEARQAAFICMEKNLIEVIP